MFSFLNKRVGVNNAIYGGFSISLCLALLCYWFFNVVDFYLVTLAIIMIISSTLVTIELLYACQLVKAKYNPKLKPLYKSEKIKPIFLYFFRVLFAQVSAYILCLVALLIAATLVQISVEFYKGDIPNASTMTKNFIVPFLMLVELVFFICTYKQGGWNKLLTILNDECNFKSISFVVIASTFAVPVMVKTATPTDRVDLMFKLIALGVVLFFIHVHQKWLDKDSTLGVEIILFRKFSVIVTTLVMFSCCYYQFIFLHEKSKNENNVVQTQDACTNGHLNGFSLMCEKFNYVYKSIK